MIKFGIIGTNWITEQFIKAAMETEGFALTAIYSRTEERAKAFADKYRAPNLFTDLDEMARSSVLDAVYIASPNSLHMEQAIRCMDGGKHVLCEKPIASNVRELTRMIDAAKKNNVVLMEAMKSTLMPNFAAIRDGLPKIGKVRRFFVGYCQYSSRYDAYKTGTILNAFNPIFSNGSLMDLGVYCLYPLAVLFGEPDQVRGSGLMLGSGVDGQGSLLLKYGEMEAVIIHSKISNSFLPCEIQGEDGTMVIDRINQPRNVEIHYRDGTTEVLSLPQEQESMFYEVNEFIGLIKSGSAESSINSHTASLATMKILDEARRQIGLAFPADR